MAKGRLSKQEKYIIEGMLKDNYSTSDIAKELGRTEKTVQAHVGKTQTTIKKKKKAKKQEPPKPAKAKDLMVNITAAKKSKGVSIMTEAASQRGDLNSNSNTVSRTAKNAIYKINDNE
jgi:IS30 family transposase